MNLSSSQLQKHETSADLSFIQKRILQMQQYLGISNEEIQYSQESLGQSVRNNQLYMNRLIQIIEIKNKEQQLVKQRNDAVQYLNQCLDSNQGSRKGVIQALITVKSTTVDLINTLSQLRNIVHYPINFELQADLNSGTLYENLQIENWISLSDVIKLFLVVRVFENSSHSEITQYLSDQNVVQTHDLTMQFFFNDQILPFVQFWLSCVEKYQQIFQQRISIPRLTYSDFLDMLESEKEQIAKYNQNMQVSQLYGQVICTVPTRLMKQGLDSYITNLSIEPQFIGLSNSQHLIKSAVKDTNGSQMLNSNSLLHSNKQIQDIKNLEQQIEDFQANDDTDQTINEMQNKLNISQIEKEYAMFCINNGQISKQKYYRKIKKVLSLVTQISLQEQKRQQIKQQIQQFIETGKGSKKSLLYLLQQLKQNIINIFYELNQFQQLIGCVINSNFKVQYIYNYIVGDFSDDLIALILKVLKYPLMNQTAEDFLHQVKKFHGSEFRVKLLFNVDLEGELKNFPTMFWYLVEKAFYKQNKKQLSFDYKLTANEAIGLCLNETMNVNKLLLLSDHCAANNIWICRVPVLTDGRTDCYKCQSGLRFPGLETELGFKRQEPEEVEIAGSGIQNASEDRISIEAAPEAPEKPENSEKDKEIPVKTEQKPPEKESVHTNDINVQQEESQELNITDTQNSTVQQELIQSVSVTTITAITNNEHPQDQSLAASVQLFELQTEHWQANTEKCVPDHEDWKKFAVPSISNTQIDEPEPEEVIDITSDDSVQHIEPKLDNYAIIAKGIQGVQEQSQEPAPESEQEKEPEIEIQQEPEPHSESDPEPDQQSEQKLEQELEQNQQDQEQVVGDQKEPDIKQEDDFAEIQLENKENEETNDALSSEYPEPPKQLNDYETEPEKTKSIAMDTNNEEDIQNDDLGATIEEPEVIEAEKKEQSVQETNNDEVQQEEPQVEAQKSAEQSAIKNYEIIAESNIVKPEADTPHEEEQEQKEEEKIEQPQNDSTEPEAQPGGLTNYNIISQALDGNRIEEDKSLSVSKD